MEKNNRFITVVIFAGLCLILALCSLFVVSQGPVEADSGKRIVMGTFAHIIAVAKDSSTAQKSIESAFEMLSRIESLMSFHSSDSEIAYVNKNAFKDSVKVSQATFDVLRMSIEIAELTSGAFDITVAPLEDLWRKAAENNEPPSEEQINQTQARIGFEKLILDSNEMTVRFSVEGMELDLGGIAKGYGIDRAVEAMQKSGAVGGMVDVGGDIRCFGLPVNEEYWMIGLQNPEKTSLENFSGDILLTLKLFNRAVVTSGDYQRYSVIGDKKYSHIIDTKTGAGTSKLTSVTIICPQAGRADGLATAVSVLGAEKGLELIEKLSDVEAIIIPGNTKNKLLKTTGIEKYIEH